MKYFKTFESFVYEADNTDVSYNEQHLNEDMGLVGDIALGVVGGLVGL
jgi:hypothetical protein